MATSVAEQIMVGTRKGRKGYHFDEEHDPAQPAQFWFQESDEGLILFVVFYSQACRWSRCLGCNLPSKMSREHVPFNFLFRQIDSLFSMEEVQRRAGEIQKVIISNNGSILDEDTFSSTALMYLLAQLNLNFPLLASLAIESRPEYVDFAELEFISRALKEGQTSTTLELCIGFEAFDENIRNSVFDKGLTLEVFEKLVKSISTYGYHLKCYFMLKPVPGMSDSEAVEDITRAIDYLDEVVSKYNVPINMHLNPTYVARGTMLEEAFLQGEYHPPGLLDLGRAAVHAKDKKISIFLGLSDEGLATEGGSFIREGDGFRLEQMERFNRTQDYEILNNMLG